MHAATSVLNKVLGGQMLTDVQTFVAALDTMFGGFRERADQTYALLKEGGTAFLVVAAPERDALREASYFVDRLDEEQMPLAGLVINRVPRVAAPGLSASRALSAAEQLLDRGGANGQVNAETTAALLRLHAAQADVAARHQQLARRFTAGHPGIPVVEVPAAAQDIHDVEGLRRGRHAPSRAAEPAGSARRRSARRGRGRTRTGCARSGCRGGARSMARRSRSVMPPHTPNSVRLSRASARHSAITGQPRQTVLACCWAAPWTNSASGSEEPQAPRWAQSSTQLVRLIRSLWLPIVTVTSISPVPCRRLAPDVLPASR